VSPAGIPDDLPSDRFVTAYETLRQQAVVAPHLTAGSPGLALLLHRGMSAWMEMGVPWLATSASERRHPTPFRPPAVRPAEVIVVLASMVRLCRAREAHDT
jgi:hypothetical protein